MSEGLKLEDSKDIVIALMREFGPLFAFSVLFLTGFFCLNPPPVLGSTLGVARLPDEYRWPLFVLTVFSLSFLLLYCSMRGWKFAVAYLKKIPLNSIQTASRLFWAKLVIFSCLLSTLTGPIVLWIIPTHTVSFATIFVQLGRE
jgi:hypothetical protein